MTKPKIIITKVDHDSWWGYYINDELYGYDDYYNFSDEEVKKEAVLRAIEDGLITKRSDPYELVFQHHTDLPEFNDSEKEDLYNIIGDEFSSNLPSSLTEFRQWIKDHA